MPTKMVRRWAVTALSALLLGASSARAQESWPDLSKPARSIGGGERDSAVVVGVENYFAVPGVPGAKSNAGEWYDYLTQTRGVPPQNVKLLTDADATREEILSAARKAAGQAGAEGTLWFVFVGHGAPSADGKDGLLVGVDAQQKAQSLQTRSVRRGELLRTLAAGPAGNGAPMDGSAWEDAGSYRVYRGGAWMGGAGQSTFRYNNFPSYGNIDLSFRLAR